MALGADRPGTPLAPMLLSWRSIAGSRRRHEWRCGQSAMLRDLARFGMLFTPAGRLGQPAPVVQPPPGRGHQLAPLPQAMTLGKPVRQHIITGVPPTADATNTTPRPATTRGNQHKNQQHDDLRLEY